jgi:hypothetical protein
MAHDVFVSHSSKDKNVADATVVWLEARGIRCWVAPRDIRPGANWGSSIGKAIRGARVMILIFSSNANTSQQITREVERAVNAGAVVIPVRIEDVLPGEDLEYFLGTPHWLDAFHPPFEQHLDALVSAIKEILQIPVTASEAPEQKVETFSTPISVKSAATTDKKEPAELSEDDEIGLNPLSEEKSKEEKFKKVEGLKQPVVRSSRKLHIGCVIAISVALTLIAILFILIVIGVSAGGSH